MQMVHHHVKYKEIHGVDEIVLVSRSEHNRIHQRLRREKKCNVPVNDLRRISAKAYIRRIEGYDPDAINTTYHAWKMYKGFEDENNPVIVG